MDEENETIEHNYSELEELLGRMVELGYLKGWEKHDVGVILFRANGNPLGMRQKDAFFYARGYLDHEDQAALKGIETATEQNEEN